MLTRYAVRLSSPAGPPVPAAPAPGELYVFDDVGRQALEVATDIGQPIGVNALGALVDSSLEVLIGGGVDLGFALFLQFFEALSRLPSGQSLLLQRWPLPQHRRLAERIPLRLPPPQPRD